MKWHSLMLLVATVASSCTMLRSEFGSLPSSGKELPLEPGTSRRVDVLKFMGAPHRIAQHGTGHAMLYEHVVISERQFAVTLNKLSAGLLKASLGRSIARHDVQIFLFDEAGLLVGIGSGAWSEKVGKGGGLQTFVDVVTVVDSSDLSRSHVELGWGREMLLPLPSTLNLRQRADLSLRGIPQRFGQFSLEQLDWRTEEF